MNHHKISYFDINKKAYCDNDSDLVKKNMRSRITFNNIGCYN